MSETDLEYKHRVLDTKSDSFCGAKWYNATIWLGSGMTTSCHHPLPHYVPVEDVIANPKALHNTAKKKEEREQMQCGERPSGCEYCWKIEDIAKDNISDRVYKSNIYEDDALQKAYDSDPSEDVNLKTLEIAFDRTCQFACSYCNPAFSTEWVKDIKKNGGFEDLISDGRNHFTHTHDSSQRYKPSETNPYIEAFFKWWESDLQHTLDELRLTGGEPLMSPHTWRLLDWLKESKSKVQFAMNSNLGMDNKTMQKLLTKTKGIENFHLYTSNESFGEQAEYIRDGLDWDQWTGNMDLLLEEGNLKGLHVMCTVNALCLETLPDFLDWCLDKKAIHGRDFPNFTLNILRFPSFQSPLILPDDIKATFKDNLQTWLNTNQDSPLLHEHEINHTQRLIDYLDVVKTPHSGTFDMPALHNDFKKFFQQYDERRGKNFTETFPVLKDWYNEL
jgi:organic radical activating enzyme